MQLNVDTLLINPLPLLGIMIGILINIKALKRRGPLIMGPRGQHVQIMDCQSGSELVWCCPGAQPD